MARTFHLPADFEQSLDRLVATGRYGGESDVIMHAIAALEDREAVRVAREARLDTLIQEGLTSAERGELADLDEVFDDLDRELRSKVQARTVA